MGSWRFFGDFLSVQKVTRAGARNILFADKQLFPQFDQRIII